MILDDKLTVAQAAEYLGCSVSFLRNKMKADEIPYLKLGNRSYFSKEDLIQLIQKVGKPHINDNSELE